MATNGEPPFTPFPRHAIEQSLPARFEEQVGRFPNRLAVKTSADALSYLELDRLANRVAQGLLDLRGHIEEPIALLMQQGTGLVAAILGVLKAGKLYLPLDPAHPVARNALTVEEAGAPLVITDQADPLSWAPSSITLDQLITGRADTAPGLPLSGDSLAYIYYTSGSTGRPKGVYDSHRNVLHNILRYTNSLEIAPSDRLTLLQSPSFSGAVSSLFSALLNGAAVFPYDLRKEGLGRNIARWLEREGITIYHSVPMIFRSFLQGEAQFPSVRLIRLEGDAASKVDVALFRSHFEPHCRLVNGLGATETGLSRQFFIGKDSPDPEGVVPIGYATADMHAAVVDDAGREVGPGTVGQITIRSRYLALGYWKQPELTVSAFGEDPAGSGERIYFTGDLGRFRSDGCLEYLGRRDAGFKIRGSRVEPAEVECALTALDGVRAAAVVGYEGVNEATRLVAYLVPTGQPPIPISLLRRGLARTLPDYMIPARFVFLDALPLSENGKVDRKALPAPDSTRDSSAPAYVSPTDDLERRLVSLWEELLDVKPVGVRDNFFELGGDSLLAESMLMSLEELSRRTLPPATIMAAPTIEQLARVIRGESAPVDDVLVPIQTDGSLAPIFCVPEHGGRVWKAFALLSRQLGPEHPFYGLQSVGLTGGAEPLTSIPAIASRYVRAVRMVQPRGPYHLGGRCFGGVVALEMAHQLIAEGETVSLLFLLDVTPEDFPGLMEPGRLRGFRSKRWRQQARSIAKRLRQEEIWMRAPHLILELTRMGSARARRRLVGWYLRRGRPVPRWLQVVSLVNQEAFALHGSRPYPGRVILLLRAEDQALYAPDPQQVWRPVSTGGLDIHWLRGASEDFATDSEAQTSVVADYLRSAIRSGESTA